MKKQGFTLAELLLCVGIIGIVGAMGAFATKHSIDQSYKGFWYNGYVNLSNAIADLEQKNKFDSGTTNYIQNAPSFASNVSETFGLGALNNSTSFTAKNGISYSFSNITNNATYYITMKVPQPKTRINPNGSATTKFAYNHNDKILMPIAGGDINLQARMDLLPFYLEDGTANYKKDASGSVRKKNVQYMPFKEAYCKSDLGTGAPVTTEEILQNMKAYIPDTDNVINFEYKKIMAKVATIEGVGVANVGVGSVGVDVSPVVDPNAVDKSLDIESLKDKSLFNKINEAEGLDKGFKDFTVIPAQKKGTTVTMIDCTGVSSVGGILKVANPKKVR